MYLLYVDESGSTNAHAEPLLSGQTPLFVIASLALRAEHWRIVDRAYLDLKRKFFSKEITKGADRAELYEVKGSELIRPGNRTNRRNHTFVRKVFELCVENGMLGFGVIFRKNPTRPTPKTSMYTMGLQYLVERFNYCLDEIHQGITPGHTKPEAKGIIIADTRMRNLDLNVATSHLSFIFGHPLGLQCTRVIEAPTFTHSELSVGIQLADIFAACLYAKNYRRNCRTLTNAMDYSHMSYVDHYLDQLQWNSVLAYNGYYVHGVRYLDHSVGP